MIDSMKAVGYRSPGSIDRADALIDVVLPLPNPGPNDLRVHVRAVSVNPVDVKVRSRSHPAPGDIRILGWDAAGVVDAVGAGVTLFKPGDEVFYAGDLGRPGANSEFHLVDERLVGIKPRSLTFEEAAAMPLTTLTAWELLFDRLHIPYGRKVTGDTLLVINGAGGVGSILIQLAARLTGLRVIATASRPDTISWVERMGAHHVVNHRNPLDRELEAIGIPQVRYVAALSATAHHLGAIKAIIAPQGHVAVIDDPVSLDIVPFKQKAVTFSWELMFTRSMFGTPDMPEQGRILNETSALLDAKVLISTLSESSRPIGAASLKGAHTRVESGSAFGKLVVSGFDDE
jgi:zinc-binding alcohol dehydrogenase family protein